MSVPGNGEKEKNKPTDIDILGHLWALQKVNRALLLGLEAAVHTMENWEQLSDETRRSMIDSLKVMIEHGKEAYADVPEIGDTQAVKH